MSADWMQKFIAMEPGLGATLTVEHLELVTARAERVEGLEKEIERLAFELKKSDALIEQISYTSLRADAEHEENVRLTAEVERLGAENEYRLDQLEEAARVAPSRVDAALTKLYTRRGQLNTSPAPSESPNTVGAPAQAGEGGDGDALTVTLGDLGFIWALGVLFGVVGCLGVVL